MGLMGCSFPSRGLRPTKGPTADFTDLVLLDQAGRAAINQLLQKALVRRLTAWLIESLGVPAPGLSYWRQCAAGTQIPLLAGRINRMGDNSEPTDRLASQAS